VRERQPASTKRIVGGASAPPLDLMAVGPSILELTPCPKQKITQAPEGFPSIMPQLVQCVAVGAAGLAFGHQMNPSRRCEGAVVHPRRCVPRSSRVHSSRSKWLGKPVFLSARRLPKKKSTKRDRLIWRSAGRRCRENNNLAKRSAAQTKIRAMIWQEDWLVNGWGLYHLGLRFHWATRVTFGGWFCPCHGSHYDLRPYPQKATPRQTCWCPSQEISWMKRRSNRLREN